jgi:hypothetical protein
MKKIIFLMPLAVIGGHAFTQLVGINTTTPDRPLTIRGVSITHELLSLRNMDNETIWHLNMANGGLNFAQSGIQDNVLFLGENKRIGLGTNLPASALHLVNHATVVNNDVITLENPASAATGIRFRFSHSTPENPYRGSGLLTVGRTGGLAFMAVSLAGSTSADPSESMRITSQGRLGIGISAPAANLHVAGSNLPEVGIFENNVTSSHLIIKGDTRSLKMGVDGFGGLIDLESGEGLRVMTGGTAHLFLNAANGNLSIGGGVPQEKLHVRGKGIFEEGIQLSNTQSGNVLDYYEATAFSNTLRNATTTLKDPVAMRLVRVGSQVTLTLRENLLDLNFPPTAELEFSVALPARFRPTGADLRVPIQVMNNGLWSMGVLIIQTNGAMRVRPNAGNASALWSGAQNAAIFAFTTSFTL